MSWLLGVTPPRQPAERCRVGSLITQRLLQSLLLKSIVCETHCHSSSDTITTRDLFHEANPTGCPACVRDVAFRPTTRQALSIVTTWSRAAEHSQCKALQPSKRTAVAQELSGSNAVKETPQSTESESQTRKDQLVLQQSIGNSSNTSKAHHHPELTSQGCINAELKPSVPLQGRGEESAFHWSQNARIFLNSLNPILCAAGIMAIINCCLSPSLWSMHFAIWIHLQRTPLTVILHSSWQQCSVASSHSPRNYIPELYKSSMQVSKSGP